MLIKKIAKITLDGYYNYGNLLQNYALQQVLSGYADTVDTIWHTPDDFMPKIWGKWTWKQPIKWLLNWKNFRTEMMTGHFGAEMVRQGKIKDWADRYIQIRMDAQDLEKIVCDYDFFVVGSDQVWNPYFGDLESNFLQFAPQSKRISYAASIAYPEIPREKEAVYRCGLSGMHAISMREQEGADTVKKLTGRDVPVHVDPTLLLTSNEWREVSRQPAWYHGEDYLLTYFLGPMPDIVRHVAAETGLILVNLLDRSVYEHYVTGVDEFIWAIEHASLVYTDSFHGTVFSILFHRPFVICDRIAAHQGDAIGGKMSSRIDTLLSCFGLESRRGTIANGYCVSHPMEFDYPPIQSVLDRERKRADDYLRTAMKLV